MPDLSKALEALRARGVEGKVGIVGFCWGGKISTVASQVGARTHTMRLFLYRDGVRSPVGNAQFIAGLIVSSSSSPPHPHKQ